MNEFKNYIKQEKTNEELLNDFLCELKRVRRENNLTQELMSYYVGISRTKIARIESGMHSPSLKSLIEILGPLGYTIKIEKIKNSR